MRLGGFIPYLLLQRNLRPPNYYRIVGDDDEGKLFTPEQYENYKKIVLPKRKKNRLYVSWTEPGGLDCKLIGPETLCFCRHRYAYDGMFYLLS